MSVLIICEKPSVAKTVALALGAAEQKDGYLSGDGLLVSWCIGHLISMADAGSYDSRIKTEARRIVDKLKDLSAPNSPNKTHFMVEISPHFDALASTKDNDRLFAMLPYKSLCFTSIKDRHGVYAMINKDERRDVSIRKPRPCGRLRPASFLFACSYAFRTQY